MSRKFECKWDNPAKTIKGISYVEAARSQLRFIAFRTFVRGLRPIEVPRHNPLTGTGLTRAQWLEIQSNGDWGDR